ncbi:hypothetical protein HIM_11980 [Hirsutella minnesotensis 3608]|uniref:LysM domain-containing protein n=1 Tax=Hirsutella minnesotensis 3608 TaxID=1043627 RepID=A0A0F7ZQX6_9HYPO|nr:hypothetical protein HIM_11980 [Hirsutella minnesotensis 3608]
MMSVWLSFLISILLCISKAKADSEDFRCTRGVVTPGQKVALLSPNKDMICSTADFFWGEKSARVNILNSEVCSDPVQYVSVPSDLSSENIRIIMNCENGVDGDAPPPCFSLRAIHDSVQSGQKTASFAINQTCLTPVPSGSNVRSLPDKTSIGTGPSDESERSYPTTFKTSVLSDITTAITPTSTTPTASSPYAAPSASTGGDPTTDSMSTAISPATANIPSSVFDGASTRQNPVVDSPGAPEPSMTPNLPIQSSADQKPATNQAATGTAPPVATTSTSFTYGNPTWQTTIADSPNVPVASTSATIPTQSTLSRDPATRPTNQAEAPPTMMSTIATETTSVIPDASMSILAMQSSTTGLTSNTATPGATMRGSGHENGPPEAISTASSSGSLTIEAPCTCGQR